MKPNVLLLICTVSVAACGTAEAPRSSPSAETPTATTSDASKPVDACSFLTEAEIADAVGNPVLDGEHDTGTTSCKWNTKSPDEVSVLLLAYRPGSLHEQAMCPDVRKRAAGAERVDGVGDAAAWKYGSMASFNFGDLEACGPKGFLSLSLNGKRDEAALKKAALALGAKAFQRY